MDAAQSNLRAGGYPVRFTLAPGSVSEIVPGPCLLCGKDPAEGHAQVWEDGYEGWLCHGDDPPDEGSCFERFTLDGERP